MKREDVILYVEAVLLGGVILIGLGQSIWSWFS